MKKTYVLLALCFLFACPNGVMAHALVGQTVSSGGAVVVEFNYSTGDVARYVKMEVFSPADEEIEHQSGRTDKNGRVVFYPDYPGEWKVIVSDNQGHRAEVPVLISELGIFETKASENTGSGAALKVVLGLSLILNLTLVAVLFSRRKSAR